MELPNLILTVFNDITRYNMSSIKPIGVLIH
jgi:hypothetical protein